MILLCSFQSNRSFSFLYIIYIYIYMPEANNNFIRSRKPANTAFRQQRLRAWQPIMTPKSVIPSFIVVGVIFISLGIILLVASNSVGLDRMFWIICYMIVLGCWSQYWIWLWIREHMRITFDRYRDYQETSLCLLWPGWLLSEPSFVCEICGL